MKKILFLIFFLFYGSLAIGQGKVLTPASDTVYWYKYYNSLASKIKAKKAKDVNEEFFFRFWDGYKAIEITKNNSVVQGNVIFFIQQFKKNKEGRIHYKSEPLTNGNAAKIHALIHEYKLLELPTDEQIKGWQHGFDGNTYISEFANSYQYSFKNYWTPTAQNELVEAKQLLGFIDEVGKIQELKDKSTRFMQRQPFQSWYGGIGGSTIVSKIITTR